MDKLSEIRYLSVSIEVAPSVAYAFASKPENLPLWAAGLGESVHRSGDHWELMTAQGRLGLRFAPQNEYGVLDHTVVLPGDVEVYVPMRVVPNGEGSEVVFGLFRQPGTDDKTFERDAELVRRDLSALKELLERK